jgi:hypothetical protein
MHPASVQKHALGMDGQMLLPLLWVQLVLLPSQLIAAMKLICAHQGLSTTSHSDLNYVLLSIQLPELQVFLVIVTST